jgi:uncharacterized membrane protein YagU involved in acid resistance
MNWREWLLGGSVGTLALTTVLAASQGLRLTRINLPFILGAMFTPDRERAKVIGFLVHLVNGLIFSLVYVAIFHSLHRVTWWIGAAIGLAHALFVLTVGLTLLPGLHPRMASEQKGPTVTRQLEPPGFLALNYGYQTPVSVVVAHLIYGAILGAFYSMQFVG